MCDPQSAVMGLIRKLRDVMKLEDQIKDQLAAAGVDSPEKLQQAMIFQINSEAEQRGK